MYNQVNLQHIKNYFKSPLVLALSIITFSSIVISYFALIPLFDIFSDLGSYFSSFYNLSSDDLDLIRSFNSSALAGTLFSSVFSLAISSLPAVAWFLINLNSKKDNGKAPSAGFMILFILSIVGVVSSSIVILYSFILFVIGIMGITLSGTYSDFPAFPATIVLFAFGLIMLFYGVYLLLYNITGLKFYSGVRKSFRSTNMVVTGKAFGVFSIITAILNLLFISGTYISVFLVVDAFKAEDYDFEKFINAFSGNLITIFIIAMASVVISAVALILQGKIAIGYFKMAKAVPVVAEQPVYMNGFNQYNQSNAYMQQPYINTNYNNYQNTYPQPQYNQNYNQPSPPVQSAPQQQTDNIDTNENPYQQ